MDIERLKKGLREINEKVKELLEEKETHEAELEMFPTSGRGDYSGEVHFRVFKNSAKLEIILDGDQWVIPEGPRDWYYEYEFDFEIKLNGKVIQKGELGRVYLDTIEELVLDNKDKIKEAGFDIDKVLRLLKKLDIEDAAADLDAWAYTREASL